MPFPKTIKLILRCNTNPLAKLPGKFSIRANDIRETDGIKLSSENKKKVRESFLSEFKENNKSKIHFYGCQHETFLRNYKDDLKIFFRRYVDADESDYILTEFSLGVMKFEFPYITGSDRFEIMLSLKKRFNFLEERLNFLGYDLEYKSVESKNSTLGFDETFDFHKKRNFKKEIFNVSGLKWQKSQADLVELIKGLALTKAFGKTSEIQLAKKIGAFVNCEIKNYEKTKNDIMRRSKDLTPFLDDIKYRIEKKRNELDEKKKNRN